MCESAFIVIGTNVLILSPGIVTYVVNVIVASLLTGTHIQRVVLYSKENRAHIWCYNNQIFLY